MRRTLAIIGIGLLVVGSLLLLQAYGIFGFTAKKLEILPQGRLEGEVKAWKTFPPFSIVVGGATYEWRVVVKNTGNIGWDNHRVLVFINQDEVRQDITQWELYWREHDGVFAKAVCTSGAASYCEFPAGTVPMESGVTRTYYFKMTIPGTAFGSYELTTRLNALVGTTVYSNIASAIDPLTIGSVSGELLLTLVGALSIFSGLGLTVAGIIKKP